MTVLAWWAVLWICGLLGWPFLAALRLRARASGYPLARIVGLLLLALAFWWLNLLGLGANDARSLGAAVGGLAVLSAGLWVRHWPTLRDALKRDWRHILVTELLFACAFGLYALYKAHDPAINHTEEPMDFAFLNSVLRSPRLPPRDPWLAGHAISYYYLGYLLVAVVARLTGAPPGVAYNLGLAQSLALAVVGCLGVLNALSSGRRDAPSRWGWPRALGAVAVLALGNLIGPLEALRALGWRAQGLIDWLGVPNLAAAPPTGGLLPYGSWWWWRASRPFLDTNLLGKNPTVIAEFPAFSLILGDLHPHLMALPVVTLALLGVTELYTRAREGSALLLDRAALPLCVAAPLFLGALGFANSWDLPTALLLALAAVWLGRWRAGATDRRSLLGAGLASVWLVLGSVLLYLPFYWTLSSQARGLGLAYYTKTPARSYVLVFGVWLVPVCAEAVRIWRLLRGRRGPAVAVWLGVVALPWLAILLLGGWGRTLLGLGTAVVRGPWLLLGLSALIALYGLALATRSDRDAGRRALPRLLVLAALVLTYAIEFFYLRDMFETRMNTLFKVYYQAWMLFGLGSCALMAWPSVDQRGAETSARRPPAPVKRGGALVWRVAALVIMALTLYYPAAAAYTRARDNPEALTLDGTAYLASLDPAAYGTYRWLQEHARADDVLVEAPGDEYDASTSRLSAFTGVPTILGWPGHVAQWRGDEVEVRRRLPDVERIYTSTDAYEVLRLLRSYDATLLYLGAREWQLYGLDAARLDWYGEFLTPAYVQGWERLYRVPAAP